MRPRAASMLAGDRFMKHNEKTFGEAMNRLIERTGWIADARNADDGIVLLREGLAEANAFRDTWAARLQKPDAGELATTVDRLILRCSLELDTCFLSQTLRLHEARAEAIKAENLFKSVLICIEMKKRLPPAEAADLLAAYRESEGIDFEPANAFTRAEERAGAYDAAYRRELGLYHETWPERIGARHQVELERVPLADLEAFSDIMRGNLRHAQEMLEKIRLQSAQ